ncbi:MAG TPA: carbohydrate ABC transporter permease [Anaerolineales bacterium]|nr:carbohydrate ABC transporter permease [Anaerolineales bacterium]
MNKLAQTLKTVLHYAVAFLVALIFVLPLYWAFVLSLGDPGAPVDTIQWWPSAFNFSNYQEIFSLVPMQRYLINSLLVVSAAVPITLLFSSLGGFGISQLPEVLRKQLLQMTITMLLIPSAAVWLFRYQILNWMGLLDSLWALILPAFAASNPLFVLLFYWAFRRIPSDMYDAARLDAAGAWTIWSQLAMPLVNPTSVGVIVLTFIMYWSDFVGPVLYIFNPQHYTLAVGMQLINQLGNQNYALIMAAAVFITGPVLVMFFLLQRFFLTDLSLANLFEKN